MSKTIELDSKPISIRFRKGQIDKIKEVARTLSFNEHKDISYVDLIRQAVEKKYPIKG